MSNSPRSRTDASLRLIDLLLKGLVRFCHTSAALALVALAGVVLFQIFARYALPRSPVWTEELSRYLFAYAVVLASGAVLIRKRHVNLELFHHRFSPRVQWSWDLVIHLVIGLFAILLLPHAWAYAANGHRQTSPALGIKLTGVFATTVIFFGITAAASVLLVARDAIRLIRKERA
ncbi:MAG: TRAP-type C4-dicarboxylate transport system permease small subunit [Candidatus Omnitrophota bacterium]